MEHATVSSNGWMDGWNGKHPDVQIEEEPIENLLMVIRSARINELKKMSKRDLCRYVYSLEMQLLTLTGGLEKVEVK